MPQTLPGSSSAIPNSQSLWYCPIEIQFTTRAVTFPLGGSLPRRTVAPISKGRPNRAAHPWGFTRMTKHSSENGWDGSRLVRVIGILHGIRVPRRRPAFLSVEPTLKSIGSRHHLKDAALAFRFRN